nr:hypothetical protein CFP56_72193 [Quercus suber]
MLRTQTPPTSTTNAPVATQATPTTMVAAIPSRETRASWMRPRGAGQFSTALNPKNSPPDLKDYQVEAAGAPTYVHTFMVNGVPLPAIERVRPWREGRGDKVAESIGAEPTTALGGEMTSSAPVSSTEEPHHV